MRRTVPFPSLVTTISVTNASDSIASKPTTQPVFCSFGFSLDDAHCLHSDFVPSDTAELIPIPPFSSLYEPSGHAVQPVLPTSSEY